MSIADAAAAPTLDPSVADEDAELMRRYAGGDVAAFDALYARHRASLHRFLVRQTRDPALAGDLFQETWSRVIAARARWQPRARFRTFLFHVARNCWIDALRARGRDATWAADPVDVDDERLHDADAPAPEALVDAAARAARLREALALLPEAQREAFLLHEEGGLTIEEVAAVTRVGAETAKSRIRYALAKLRRALSADRAASTAAAGDPA